MRNPEPEIRNPEPEKRNPEPEIRNPEPEIRNPEPEIRNPESEIRNLEPNQLDGCKPGTWKVDVRLPGKGNSNSHGARPVHQIVSMMKWIRTSRLSIKRLFLSCEPGPGAFVPRDLTNRGQDLHIGHFDGVPIGAVAGKLGRFQAETISGIEKVAPGRDVYTFWNIYL